MDLAVQLGLRIGLDHLNADAGSGLDAPFLQQLTADLKANPGRSLVVAGPGQLPVVHAIVWDINRKLGNIARTCVHYPYEGRFSELSSPIGTLGPMEELPILLTGCGPAKSRRC